ncbi:MAG TPA: TetR/AcrR family transcriptional regulator [Labilithrix sp.]|nr:TetR/AcrR family transcriptional regulator [Labilithrix sp.]
MVAPRPAETGSVRERLIAAATHLFAARGFEATPIQAIADEVGLTKPALLHHFPSKEHLRLEVLSSILSYWNETLPRLLLAATASSDRFDTVFNEVYRFFAAEPERARFVAREALDRPTEARKLLRGILPVVKAIASYIRVGQEHGRHYDDADADAYVIHVLQFVIGAVAVSDVTTAALGTGTEGRVRYDRELARIAKASLFESHAAPRTNGERNAPTKRDKRRRRT